MISSIELSPILVNFLDSGTGFTGLFFFLLQGQGASELLSRGVQKNQKSDFELALYCFPFVWVPIDTVQNFSSLGGLERPPQVTPYYQRLASKGNT